MSHVKNNNNLASDSLKKKHKKCFNNNINVHNFNDKSIFSGKTTKVNEISNIGEKTYTNLKSDIDQISYVDGVGIQNLEEKYWLNWKPKQHPFFYKKSKNPIDSFKTSQSHRNKTETNLRSEYPQTYVSKSVNCIILPKLQDASLQTEEIKLNTPLTLNKKTSTSSIKTGSNNASNGISSVNQNMIKYNVDSTNVTKFKVVNEVQNNNIKVSKIIESTAKNMKSNDTAKEKRKHLEKNPSSHNSNTMIQNQWKGGSYPLKSCPKTSKNIYNFKKATSNSSIPKMKFATK